MKRFFFLNLALSILQVSSVLVHVRNSLNVTGERAECQNLRNYEIKENGQVMCWKGQEKPKECFSSFSSTLGGKRAWKPLEKGVVQFMNDFLKNQRRILCTVPADQQRVFFTLRYNGLGNSILGTMSTLMMGALDDRLVVLHGWKGEFDRAFDSPLGEFTMENLQKLKLLDAWDANACPPGQSSKPGWGCFGPDGDDQFTWCGHVGDHYPNRLNLVSGCCNNKLPFFMMNPNYAPRLKKVFGDNEMSTPLMRVLFRPSAKEVFSKLTLPKPGTVAVHIRTFGNVPIDNLISSLGSCAKSTQSKLGTSFSEFKVAAIENSMLDKFNKSMGSKTRIVTNKPPGGEFHGGNDWVHALQDMLEMGFSDSMVLSPWSSFGQMAAAYGGQAPYEVDGDYGHITTSCYQVSSSEPCSMRQWGPDVGFCPGKKMAPLAPKHSRTCNKPKASLLALDGTAAGTFEMDQSSASAQMESMHQSMELAGYGPGGSEWQSVAMEADETFQNTIQKYAGQDFPEYCPSGSLWQLYPQFASALKKKALERAIDNKVFVTMADSKYAEKLGCWEKSVDMMTKMNNTVIIATDAETLDVCRKNKLSCVDVDASQVPHMKKFGEIGFVKFYSLALVASLKLDFIFSEMDIVIMKNPWPYHEKEDPEQYSVGDSRCIPEAWIQRDPLKANAPAEEANIQVTGHSTHPRVNIGYMYSRGSIDSMQFFAHLTAYYAGKCADNLLGYVPPPSFYVDDGHADQNIFDAFLKNSDHTNAHYADVPWNSLSKNLKWKLLDYRLFGIYGKNQEAESVTFHYAGIAGLQVSCWDNICANVEGKQPMKPELVQPTCLKMFSDSTECSPRSSTEPTLQAMLPSQCLPARMTCESAEPRFLK
eukprot:TRINITY_DN47964_c0_g1_i1.p1 TRINITY_DN47964_c0_g1~~TRINITY_DN47964_c0_g1_i1.p1  ORF type:complete len:872 (+),score=163.49 TRINITY_DN47964_c0_g1_i1:133-2748(+)